MVDHIKLIGESMITRYNYLFCLAHLRSLDVPQVNPVYVARFVQLHILPDDLVLQIHFLICRIVVFAPLAGPVRAPLSLLIGLLFLPRDRVEATALTVPLKLPRPTYQAVLPLAEGPVVCYVRAIISLYQLVESILDHRDRVVCQGTLCRLIPLDVRKILIGAHRAKA